MKLTDILALGSRRVGQELREAFYLRTSVDLTKPLTIRAIVTNRCNYKCASCDYWRRDSYPEEMSLTQWTDALSSIRQFVGPFNIQFAGGEPFLFKPFLQLAEWCGAHDIAWGVITNGSALSAANVKGIVAAKPLNLDISVDGASAAVHDASRGIPGSLQRISAGLRSLRAARDAAGSSFPIRIKPTVHRHNFHEMPKLVEWAVEAGATSIDFSPIHRWTPEVTNDLWLRQEKSEHLEQVVQELVAAKRAGAPIETEESRLLSWPAHFRDETLVPAVAPCRVGMRNFQISPDGEVHLCWMYPNIGNLKDTAARDLWHGPIAKEQRATMTTCAKFGSTDCATSCLSYRTIGQDWKRFRLLSRQPNH